MAPMTIYELNAIKTFRFGRGYDPAKASNAIYAVQWPDNDEFPLPICPECGECPPKNDHSEFCSVAINARLRKISSIIYHTNIPLIELDVKGEVSNGRNGQRVGMYSIL